MNLYPQKACKALGCVCLWRSTLFCIEKPSFIPDTMETLRYIASVKACGTRNPETIKQDEGLLLISATTSKRKRRNYCTGDATNHQKKGEGWRNINGTQIWFENAWHANYARFLDRFPDVAARWLYKPRKFRIGPFGIYEPTFFVHYVKSGPYWVELDSHIEEIDDKTSVFEVYKPKERMFVLDRAEFLKKEEFFKYSIPEWESVMP